MNQANGHLASAGTSTDLNAFLTLAQTFAARGDETDSALYEAFRSEPAVFSTGQDSSLTPFACLEPLTTSETAQLLRRN